MAPACVCFPFRHKGSFRCRQHRAAARSVDSDRDSRDNANQAPAATSELPPSARTNGAFSESELRSDLSDILAAVDDPRISPAGRMEIPNKKPVESDMAGAHENTLSSDANTVKGSTELRLSKRISMKTMNTSLSQTKGAKGSPSYNQRDSPAFLADLLAQLDQERKLSSKRVDEVKAERARLRHDLYQALAYYLVLQVGNLVLAKLFAHRTHSCKVFWSPFYIHASACLWICVGTCVRVAVVMMTMSTNHMELETQEAECTMITNWARALRAQEQAF